MTKRRLVPWLTTFAVLLAACGEEPNGQSAWQFEDGFGVEEQLPANNEATPNNATTPPANNMSTVNNSDPQVACESDDDCELGDACEASGDGRFCEPAIGVADGESCGGDTDCQSGRCINDWPDGYCTTVGCEDRTDCARLGNDNRCLLLPNQQNICVRICTADSDCREGYFCEALSRDEGLCAPGTPEPPFDPAVFDNQALTLTCQMAGDTTSIDYTIADDTAHYMITPFHKGGGDIQPRTITLPDGSQANLRGSEGFLSTGSYLYGFMNPTLMPATASRAAQVQPGAHTYALRNTPGEMCHYLLEESTAGTIIDFNIYLVGVNGKSAATAAQDTDFQAMIAKFDQIYSPMGYTSGNVNFIDVTGDDADRFRILRSEQDVSALVQLSEVPQGGLNEALSLNVFFVEAFALGGAIGISLGLPGPAGLHGTVGSGVAFTSEFLGGTVEDRFVNRRVDGNDYTGIVFAHEVGHYLGLFHTSEQDGNQFDPLADTPECASLSRNCPDINNLMFPFAGITHTEVSADQGFVIGANPLTKEATP